LLKRYGLAKKIKIDITVLQRGFMKNKCLSLLRSLQTVAAVCLFSATVSAATFTVNQAGDAGDSTCDATCTLRDAIDDANNAAGNDTINFAGGLTTITLTAEIIITNVNGNLDINGPGANVLTIDGGAGTNRIFFIDGATVVISGVTLTGGNGTGAIDSGNAGAVYVNAGTLTLESVHVTGNSVTGLSFAGGVYFNGGSNHRIRNSTFSNNVSDTDCGGFFNTGGSVTIVNSTFSGNSATGQGDPGSGQGGAFCSDADTTLRNVTISGNTALDAGGFVHGTGTLNTGNSIIAGNTATGAGNPPEIRFVSGTFTSAGNNLVGDSAGDSTNTGNPVTYQGSDVQNTPPSLGALQNNGGTTPTRALLAGSPAIDAGSDALAVDPFDSSALTTDQRGTMRILDGNGDSTATVDIGAFEFVTNSAASVTVSGRVFSAKGRGVARAIVSATDQNGETRIAVTNSFGYYRFYNVAAGEIYVFTVSSKSYRFAPRIVNVAEDLAELNFMPN
jgi:hypothetical protein